jgi:hypothetical protein
MTETTFTLVRTDKSRGGGDDDYDVCDGDKVIGRIVRHPQAPIPWFWVIVAEGFTPSWLMDRGYAVSREGIGGISSAMDSQRSCLPSHSRPPDPTDARVHRSLRSVQRPNLGRLEQSKRREADLFAMRPRQFFGKPVRGS